jgi:hypothetical protein
MAGLTIPRIAAISAALSTPRMSRYVTTCGNDHARALDLYEWNAEVAAAFMVPMHICEVVLRNAIVGAIEEVYGSNWCARGTAFERSLPKPVVGYSPFRDLDISRQGQTSAGKVIPELKFMFWVSMVTARHDRRLWIPHIAKFFPALRPTADPRDRRRALHARLDEIRKLRNRIAHHEPIYDRHLLDDYSKVVEVVSWISADVMDWLRSFEKVTALIARRP